MEELYREWAARLGLPESEHLRTILRKLASPQQVKIVNEMPAPPEEISQKLGIDVAVVNDEIRNLYEKGVIVLTRKGYRPVRSVFQLHDSALANPKFDAEVGPEFFAAWRALGESGWYDDLAKTMSEPIAMNRVLPHWRSIADSPDLLPAEDLRQVLQNATDIALLHCPCKREAGERSCDIPEEVCLNLDATARYNIDRGAAKKVTVEEAMAVIDRCEKLGVFHFTGNQEMPPLLCNCHECCCILTKMGKWVGNMQAVISPSRYLSVVDAEACTGCEDCARRCQVGAMKITECRGADKPTAIADAGQCMGCGNCWTACAAGAITMKLVRPREHIPVKIAIY